MFAIVRTGGKQYRVAAGDKIAVEKIDGEAGDTVSLGDILLAGDGGRSEEHTSELQSLMRLSYAVFSLKNKQQDYACTAHSITHGKRTNLPHESHPFTTHPIHHFTCHDT